MLPCLGQSCVPGSVGSPGSMLCCCQLLLQLLHAALSRLPACLYIGSPAALCLPRCCSRCQLLLQLLHHQGLLLRLLLSSPPAAGLERDSSSRLLCLWPWRLQRLLMLPKPHLCCSHLRPSRGPGQTLQSQARLRPIVTDPQRIQLVLQLLGMGLHLLCLGWRHWWRRMCAGLCRLALAAHVVLVLLRVWMPGGSLVGALWLVPLPVAPLLVVHRPLLPGPGHC